MVVIRFKREGTKKTLYETQMRSSTQTYTVQVPIYRSYNGCGCRGTYVAGYSPETRTRTVQTPVQVAVAQQQVIPIVNVTGVKAAFEDSKEYTVQVPKTVSYTENVPIYRSYNGCGCRGTYVAGYTPVTRTRTEMVTEKRVDSFVSFENRLPKNFVGPDGKQNGQQNKFVEGILSGTFVSRTLPTNENGSLKDPAEYGAQDMGNKLAQQDGDRAPVNSGKGPLNNAPPPPKRR